MRKLVSPTASSHTHEVRGCRAGFDWKGSTAPVGLASGTPSALVCDDDGGPAGAVSDTAWMTEKR